MLRGEGGWAGGWVEEAPAETNKPSAVCASMRGHARACLCAHSESAVARGRARARGAQGATPSLVRTRIKAVPPRTGKPCNAIILLVRRRRRWKAGDGGGVE